MKILDKRHIITEKKVQYVSREKEVLTAIDHPFFVRLYFTFQDTDNLCILHDMGKDWREGEGELREREERYGGAGVLVCPPPPPPPPPTPGDNRAEVTKLLICGHTISITCVM